MSTVSRQAAQRIATSGLPGLVHFGVRPLCLKPERAVKRLRLHLQGVGMLDLQEVKFVPVTPEALANASVTASSSGSPGTAGRVSVCRIIRTLKEENPFWQLTLQEPVAAEEIRIVNRLGPSCVRNYGLCAEIEDGEGGVQSLDNLDPMALFGRLEEFQSEISRFVEAAAAIPCLRLSADRLRSGADALVAGMTVALGGERSSPDELRDRRRQLLSSIVGMYELVTGAELRKITTASWPVLDWLLYRGNSAAEGTPSADESRAIAAMLCKILYRRPRVAFDVIRENSRFLSGPEQVTQVEDLVNRYYAAATGDTASLPIMFRKHTMSGSLLHRDAEAYVASMKEIEGIFEDMNYAVALCYGTLLGAVREGDFIRHDDDVDMAIALKSPPAGQAAIDAEWDEIVRRLRERGVSAGISRSFQFLKVTAPRAGMRVDVFPIIPRPDDKVAMFMDGPRIRDVERDVVLPFKPIAFRGETFKAPACPEAFLADRYGEDWRVPKRQFGSGWLDA